jgi:hypothetical protein
MIIAMLSIGGSAFAQSKVTVDALDALVQSGRLVEANFEINRLPELPPELSAWLEQKAEAGLPPFQYEYSRRLLLAKKVPGAVRWYARGYIERSLDFVECTDQRRNTVHMVIGTAYRPVLDWVLKDKPMYAHELADAIEWESKRKVRQESSWLCGPQQIPVEERAAARAAHIAEIKHDIERLSANGR